LPELGGLKAAVLPPLPTPKAKAKEVKVLPASGKELASPSGTPAAEAPLGKTGGAPAAPIGLSVGFGAAPAAGPTQ
jgi:hypothetical protein